MKSLFRGRISPKCATRPGSALLVVLGMLSFMVISGLAFSVFMRTTRLSSSFTRRTVTTRQLAKAALAEAIDQIDRAVANDPHPGVRNPYRNYLGTPSSQSTAADFDPLKIDNVWSHRVLIGQAGELNSLDSGVTVQIGPRTYYPAFVDEEDTISVLALEALAYLPPSLINEVRYYGQRTPTAAWQSLDFDAGRFAYVAVDVSDFFDVNRICATMPRSSDPMSRVTLGHIFETDMTHKSAGSKASDWESFMGSDLKRTVGADGSITFGSTVPLTSIADLNLALGTRVSAGGLKSPFYEYFNQKSSSGVGFYLYTENSAEYERYALMNFVTDSLMAPRPEREMKTTGDNWDILNLADDSNQIFPELTLHASQENRTLYAISQTATPAFSRLVQKRIPRMTMFQLSDYLDWDRVPISLGLPSVERVPMICGIKPNLGSSPSIVLKQQVDEDDPKDSDLDLTAPVGTKVEVKRKVHWRIDPESLKKLLGGVSVLVAYPFRNHEQASESSCFTLDGKVQLFLSTKTMPLRTGNADDCLHWGAGGSGGETSPGEFKFVERAVLNLPLQEAPISFSYAEKQDDYQNYVKQTDMTIDLSVASKFDEELTDEKGDVLCVTYKWTRTLQQGQNGNPNYYDNKVGAGDIPSSDFAAISLDSTDQPTASFCALDASGKVDTGFLKTIKADSELTFNLNFVPTVRVRSSDSKILGSTPGTKTLDMVPASISDDKAVNNVDNVGGLGALFAGLLNNFPTPLMKFDTAVTFAFKPQDKGDISKAVAFTPSAVLVNDPRYNHAPENWVAAANFSPQGWYNEAKNLSSLRDGDVFMASSDQDYMQSPYEFAFLPRYSNLEQYDDAIRGDIPGYPNSDNSWTRLCEKTPIDEAWMWKTYDIFGRYTDDGDDFDGLGLEYEGNGLRVNPYSNFNSVLMAALANAPHDWRVASNNEDENPGSSAMDNADAFNKQHAWNAYSSGASLKWEMLEDVADQFYDRMRDGFTHQQGSFVYGEDKKYAIQSVSDEYAPIWQDAFAKWFGFATGTDADRYLCNVKLDDDCSSVYGVDKKFLYGYWKSCFAARQQLYLVFFRAEPMMLGGGIAGVTPPQLGAKGVALVWRDPYDPNERKNKSAGSTVTRHYPNSSGNGDYIPHKTRVLFYKQFE